MSLATRLFRIAKEMGMYWTLVFVTGNPMMMIARIMGRVFAFMRRSHATNPRVRGSDEGIGVRHRSPCRRRYQNGQLFDRWRRTLLRPDEGGHE